MKMPAEQDPTVVIKLFCNHLYPFVRMAAWHRFATIWKSQLRSQQRDVIWCNQKVDSARRGVAREAQYFEHLWALRRLHGCFRWRFAPLVIELFTLHESSPHSWRKPRKRICKHCFVFFQQTPFFALEGQGIWDFLRTCGLQQTRWGEQTSWKLWHPTCSCTKSGESYIGDPVEIGTKTCPSNAPAMRTHENCALLHSKCRPTQIPTNKCKQMQTSQFNCKSPGQLSESPRVQYGNICRLQQQCFRLQNAWRRVLQPRKFIPNLRCVLSVLSKLSWVCSFSQTLAIQSWLSEPSMTKPLKSGVPCRVEFMRLWRMYFA